MNRKCLINLKSLLIVPIIVVCCYYLYYFNYKPFNSNNATNLNESRIKVLNFFNSIQEKKVFSQNKEDGVILSLIKILDLSQRGGSFVEFGTESGTECNTRNIRENFAWKGLLLDGSNDNPEINLHKENIFYSTIVDVFKKYNVDKEVDIFSEDTDYADYWIVEKVIKSYRPKIVIHEVNQQTGDLCVTVPKPNPDQLIFWESGSEFHGASVCAFHCLAKRNKYTMV